MRIMVMGVTGMLGHQLLQDLTDGGHEVVGTVRGSAGPRIGRVGVQPSVLTGIDALSTSTVEKALHEVRPEAVINCIGFVKQLESPQSAAVEVELNARFPHTLARLCSDLSARLIHISTDCVFSGDRGLYRETDAVDPVDLYGRSKAAGEVTGLASCLTIRTSIIGHELATSHGLLEWFLGRTGTIVGRSRAIFSGFPTTVLARIIDEYILPAPNLHGLYHVSAEPISKYDLLLLFKQIYGHPVEIERDDRYRIDRSLDSALFRRQTGFEPESWADMVADMARSSRRSLTRGRP